MKNYIIILLLFLFVIPFTTSALTLQNGDLVDDTNFNKYFEEQGYISRAQSLGYDSFISLKDGNNFYLYGFKSNDSSHHHKYSYNALWLYANSGSTYFYQNCNTTYSWVCDTYNSNEFSGGSSPVTTWLISSDFPLFSNVNICISDSQFGIDCGSNNFFKFPNWTFGSSNNDSAFSFIFSNFLSNTITILGVLVANEFFLISLSVFIIFALIIFLIKIMKGLG